MAKATRLEMEQRVEELAQMLLQGHGNTACVQHAAQQWGVKRRQAYRLIERSWALIRSDTEKSGCDRRALLAWTIDRLMRAAAQGLELKNPSASVGALKELNLLVGLGAHSGTVHRR